MKKRLIAAIFSLTLLTSCTTAGAGNTSAVSSAPTETSAAVTEASSAQTEAASQSTAETTASETTAAAPSTQEIDIKTLDENTDYKSLTNAVRYTNGNGTFNVDLDGDGKDEEIFLETKIADKGTLWADEDVLYININGKEFALDEGSGIHTFAPAMCICDIDSSDSYKELAFSVCAVTDDFYTVFFRYENGEMKQLFDIMYDTADGCNEEYWSEINAVMGVPFITDGSGIITAANRLSVQTCFAYSRYKYDSASGQNELIYEPVYPYYYKNMNDYAALEKMTAGYYNNTPNSPITKEVTLYKDPDLNSESFVLAQKKVIVSAECPEKAVGAEFEPYWFYVCAEDGTGGWAYCHDGINIKTADGTETEVYSVFSGLILYD